VSLKYIFDSYSQNNGELPKSFTVVKAPKATGTIRFPMFLPSKRETGVSKNTDLLPGNDFLTFGAWYLVALVSEKA